MRFQMVHENYNVKNLERSMEFYKNALGITEKRRIEAPDGSFIIVYLGNKTTDFELELTWLRDFDRPYNLGDCEFHLAFAQITLRQLTNSMKKWDASVLKIKKWVFTSFLTQTGTGWKLYRIKNKRQ